MRGHVRSSRCTSRLRRRRCRGSKVRKTVGEEPRSFWGGRGISRRNGKMRTEAQEGCLVAGRQRKKPLWSVIGAFCGLVITGGVGVSSDQDRCDGLGHAVAAVGDWAGALPRNGSVIQRGIDSQVFPGGVKYRIFFPQPIRMCPRLPGKRFVERGPAAEIFSVRA